MSSILSRALNFGFFGTTSYIQGSRAPKEWKKDPEISMCSRYGSLVSVNKMLGVKQSSLGGLAVLLGALGLGFSSRISTIATVDQLGFPLMRILTLGGFTLDTFLMAMDQRTSVAMLLLIASICVGVIACGAGGGFVSTDSRWVWITALSSSWAAVTEMLLRKFSLAGVVNVQTDLCKHRREDTVMMEVEEKGCAIGDERSCMQEESARRMRDDIEEVWGRDMGNNGKGGSLEEDLGRFLEHLDMNGEDAGEDPWESIVDKTSTSVDYKAWRRDPKNGGATEYKSWTRFHGCSAEVVRDFYMDCEHMQTWEPMVKSYRRVEVEHETGLEVGHFVKKYPLCSAREYVLAWRVWEAHGAYFCITKAADHSDVERKQKPKRVDVYHCGWRIRNAEDGSVEVDMMIQEDTGMQRDMAKMVFRRGIWGYIRSSDVQLRIFAKKRLAESELDSVPPSREPSAVSLAQQIPAKLLRSKSSPPWRRIPSLCSMSMSLANNVAEDASEDAFSSALLTEVQLPSLRNYNPYLDAEEKPSHEGKGTICGLGLAMRVGIGGAAAVAWQIASPALRTKLLAAYAMRSAIRIVANTALRKHASD